MDTSTYKRQPGPGALRVSTFSHGGHTLAKGALGVHLGKCCVVFTIFTYIFLFVRIFSEICIFNEFSKKYLKFYVFLMNIQPFKRGVWGAEPPPG